MNVHQILEEFHWARSLSRNLLEVLSEDRLAEIPIVGAGNWRKQFLHMYKRERLGRSTMSWSFG